MSKAIDFIDKKLFPSVIDFAVNRWHIVGVLLLGIALMLISTIVFQLKGQAYTNVLSAVVGLLILREEILQKKSHGDIHSKLDKIHKEVTK